MTMHVEKRIGQHFIEILCHGPYSTPAMVGIIDDALVFAIGNGFNAALIDWRSISEIPTVMDRFDLGRNFADLQYSKVEFVRLALVGSVPQIDHQRFGETVARNRGAVIRVFEDRDEAATWLQKKSD
jgi:hypothetical protein